MRLSPLCNLLTEDEAADLLRISPRTLRSIRAAGKIRYVRPSPRLLDHTDVTTTAKYAHALEDDIRAMLPATETGQEAAQSKPDQEAFSTLQKGKSALQ